MFNGYFIIVKCSSDVNAELTRILFLLRYTDGVSTPLMAEATTLMVSKTWTTFEIRPKSVEVGDPAARAASDRLKRGTEIKTISS